MNRTENEVISTWKTNELPIVSVLCITYNHEKFITQAIEGFLEQETDFPFEIIIHDDASTDATVTIVRSFQNRYPRIITTILQKENQLSLGKKCTSIAIPYCRGKYIALCEGDDYWCDSKKLQKQADFLEKNQDYILCSHLFKPFDQESQKYGIIANANRVSIDSQGIEVTNSNNLKYWFTKTLTIVFRNRAVDVPALNKKYKYYRDIHLFYHLLQAGKGFCLNFLGGVYRLHNSGSYSKISILSRSKTNYFLFKELAEKNISPLLKRKHIKSYRTYIEKMMLFSEKPILQRILWREMVKMFVLSPIQFMVLIARLVFVPIFKPVK